MTCDACNGDTEVFDSRPTDGQRVIRRRRKCLACGAKMTTYEVSADVYSMMRATMRALAHLERAGANAKDAVASLAEAHASAAMVIASEYALALDAKKAS